MPHYLTRSIRAYCYTDLRWVTSGDDHFGANVENVTESGGTGTDPILEWEHQGFPLDSGDTIDSLWLAGLTDNTQVTDLEIRGYFRRPTNASAWTAGYDADGEMTNTLVFTEMWMTGQTGEINDRRGRLLTIDWTAPAQGEISLYFKPSGTLTATRYFPMTQRWRFSIANEATQGPEGPEGPQGATGAQGPAGNDGATGPQGPQGPAGADGATGATGPQGPEGQAGSGGGMTAAPLQKAGSFVNEA